MSLQHASHSSSSPLEFCVLASGSAGNCTAVFLGHGINDVPARSCVLVDAGLSPRRTDLLLRPLGARVHDVRAILLTHLDSDHMHPGWLRVIARRTLAGLPLRMHVHRRHRTTAWRCGLTARETELFEDTVSLPGGACAHAVLLAHDDLGSVGFVIEHAAHRLGYATDLGRVPRTLLSRFVNLHGLCLESNYDCTMQEQSLRPAFLKRRIMNGQGHLSNEQALEATREIARNSHLSHIALLHLSRECNCPQRVRRLWEARMPAVMPRLTITSQHAPTPLLRVARPATPVSPRQAMFEFALAQ